MQVIRIRAAGGPEVLVPDTADRPQPASGELLIRVAAAGVNRPDCLQRRGLYPPPPGAPDIPGLEVAGIVAGMGKDVSGWKTGDRVCALLAGGGYAEYCVAPAPQCLPVPATMSLVEAAALPETFFTVWTNVFERGALQSGETLLVHGGASGIGTTAIQLARGLGATVFATAGSDAKTTLCRKLGAELAINYREDSFLDRIREHTGGRGVDVILDIVGGRYLKDNIKALAVDGRLVIIGLLGGSRAELPLGPILAKRLTITGSTLRAREVTEKGRIAAALKQQVWPLLEQGSIRPVIQATFPLDEAFRAHELLEANAAMGKLVLTVDPA